MIAKARFIVPVESPPIENGAIQFDDGIILSVGPADSFRSRGAVDYGDAVIFPGFVNAHTHLELSVLEGRVPPSRNFTDWLERLIAARNHDLAATSSSQEDRGGEDRSRMENEYILRAVETGISQSLSAGVTAIADITAYPHWTRPALARSPLRGVSFGEVIAMGKGRALLDSRLDAAADLSVSKNRVKVGVSPHAPYSVEPDALRACAARAARAHLPLSIHVAETPDEEIFTRQSDGKFADFLRGLGLWDNDIRASGCSPVELLASAGALTPQTILAHANYVSDVDISLIANSGASVAFCPRTHAAFEHAPHRFRDMLAAGINVCLGTDSLASNPSLSIIDEARFLHSTGGDISPAVLLSMGTLHGARALQMASQIGSLRSGKSADFCVISLPKAAHRWAEVLENTDSPVATVLGGVSV